MKILIASVRDTGGTGYNLAHAVNSVCKNHQAIDLTAQKSYINYPTMAYMGDYSIAACRKMIYKADALVFLGAFKPLITGLKLAKRKLRDKKKLLLFMGSEWRYGRKELLEQADTMLKRNYRIAVGGSGMFMPGEDKDKTPCPSDVTFLPPTRGFKEIKRLYSLCNQDRKAVETFGTPRQRVVFMHAPTSEERKGSETFYRAVTKAMQIVPTLTSSTIRGQPWANCLRAIATSDVLFDQNPPFPAGYGAISIEAAIFKLPVISRVNPDCIKWLMETQGLKVPIIGWKDDDDLLKKVWHLATQPELRKTYGDAMYKFCKQLHDEKPVVDRLLKIFEEMN